MRLVSRASAGAAAGAAARSLRPSSAARVGRTARAVARVRSRWMPSLDATGPTSAGSVNSKPSKRAGWRGSGSFIGPSPRTRGPGRLGGWCAFSWDCVTGRVFRLICRSCAPWIRRWRMPAWTRSTMTDSPSATWISIYPQVSACWRPGSTSTAGWRSPWTSSRASAVQPA